MARFMNAFTALLFGSGILVLCVGLFADVYNWKLGIIGLVTLWVIAFALRVFLATRDDD
jgi:type IV secretory pathway TrbD component